MWPAEVSITDIKVWKRKFPFILENYSPKDIVDANETKVYFSPNPTKVFGLKGDKYAGRKFAKQSMTKN